LRHESPATRLLDSRPAAAPRGGCRNRNARAWLLPDVSQALRQSGSGLQQRPNIPCLLLLSRDPSTGNDDDLVCKRAGHRWAVLAFAEPARMVLTVTNKIHPGI